MILINPYLVTALLFAVILFIGRWIWHWRDVESAFVLLFFFLVAIGIRLDEIAKKIAAVNDKLDRLLETNKTTISVEQKVNAGSLPKAGSAGDSATITEE